MHVLVVDDDPDIRRFMSYALAAQGMRVASAADAATALRQLAETAFDLVLLDVLMPGVSGMELLAKILKTTPRQRVIMVSALTDARTKVACFELGAVDYLSKPFALAELVARVRVHQRLPRAVVVPAQRVENRATERRAGERRGRNRRGLLLTQDVSPEDGRWLRTPVARLDLVGRRLHIASEVVNLSERETLVLACLMRRFGDVCTREEILDAVWGAAAATTGNVVDVYVGRLRVKLPADSITTVRNAGYAFGSA